MIYRPQFFIRTKTVGGEVKLEVFTIKNSRGKQIKLPHATYDFDVYVRRY